MSLVPGKDNKGKTRKKRKTARVSAFLMFSTAVREHMDRTFGGAAAVTEHFNSQISSEMPDEGPPLSLAKIKMAMIGYMWRNASLAERDFFEAAAQRSNEVADAMALDAAEHERLANNKTESIMLYDEDEDEDEDNILIGQARSDQAGKGLESQKLSGKGSKKVLKKGDAGEGREAKGTEDEADEAAQDKSLGRKALGKQSAKKSGGVKVVDAPDRARAEPVGGKAEGKTKPTRSKADTPDASKTNTKLNPSAPNTTTSSTTVTSTAEARATRDATKGEETTSGGVVDNGAAVKASGVAEAARKGQAKGKETANKSKGKPKDVERAESAKGKEGGGSGVGTSDKAAGGKSKKKDKSKNSAKRRIEEVQESDSDEGGDKKRREEGEAKAQQGGTVKEKKSKDADKGSKKAGARNSNSNGTGKRQPAKAKAGSEEEDEDFLARPEKRHKGAGKGEGGSKSSSVDKRGDKHKGGTNKSAAKSSGREETTAEKRKDKHKGTVKEADSGTSGKAARRKKGDQPEATGTRDKHRDKDKGKGKAKGHSTGSDTTDNDDDDDIEDATATNKAKGKRKDAEKARASKKKTKASPEKSGKKATAASAKVPSATSKANATDVKGKGKRGMEKETKSAADDSAESSDDDDGSAVEDPVFGLDRSEKTWIEVEWEVEVQKSGRKTQQGVEWFVASVDLSKEVDKGKAKAPKWRINYSRRGSLPASKSKVMFISSSKLIDDYQLDEPLRWRKKQTALEAAAEKAAALRHSISAAGSLASSGDQEAEWLDDFGVKPRRR